MSQKTDDAVKTLIADLPIEQSVKDKLLADLAGGKAMGEVLAAVKEELAKLSPEDTAAAAAKIDALYDAEVDVALSEFDKDMTFIEENPK